jgi:photosystem II stability/assembly factor-like uncharacterized protein
MFVPSISPHQSGEMYVSCDMSEVFHTVDYGQTWVTLPFQEIQGGRFSKVCFTENPTILYALDLTSIEGGDTRTPVKSLDGGMTWAPLGVDPTSSEAFSLFVDPANGNRILLSDWCRLYFSDNGGNTFALKYTANCGGDGLHLAGVLFAGNRIFVGTNEGLLVSENSGGTFTPGPTSGIPAGKRIASFTGARQGETIRLYALVADSVYGGIPAEDFFYGHQEVYLLEWGQSSWVSRNTGLPTAEGYGLAFIAGADNDPATAYVAGQTDHETPMIFRTTNAGLSWENVLLTDNNQQIQTGWAGYRGDRDWSYGGGPVGFCVASNDKAHLAFTDYGFLHRSTDGGNTWSQAYLHPEDENPAGLPTPKGRDYRGVGLENTSCWWLTWSDPQRLFACFTDIRGIRTEDGGKHWTFRYTGHTENTAYHCLKHPTTGHLFLATSTIHDLYESTYLTDSRIDGGDGHVLFSTDQGQTWAEHHDFNHPVIWLAMDPNNPNRLLASVVHSSQGGIFECVNSAAASPVWNKLANPPRTEGHPFNIQILKDGTLVCTYSGRRVGSAFTASSGVFVSLTGGASWEDRSHPGMHYWTKDVVIDPHDPSQNTWYVGVFSGWGGPSNDLGGLYKTTQRGATWTRILTLHRVTSCTLHPDNPNEMYVTSETEGLWYTDNLNDPTPSFRRIDSYPFRQPERVFFNPYLPGEIWVTSFGNGIRIGSMIPNTGNSSWHLY